MSDVIERLTAVLEERKGADPETSYVASLNKAGLNRILEKVGEEAIETVLAARDAAEQGDTRELIKETADLWFHTLVMLVHMNQDPTDVLEELERRFGTSGIEEKASRAK